MNNKSETARSNRIKSSRPNRKFWPSDYLDLWQITTSEVPLSFRRPFARDRTAAKLNAWPGTRCRPGRTTEKNRKSNWESKPSQRSQHRTLTARKIFHRRGARRNVYQVSTGARLHEDKTTRNGNVWREPHHLRASVHVGVNSSPSREELLHKLLFLVVAAGREHALAQRTQDVELHILRHGLRHFPYLWCWGYFLPFSSLLHVRSARSVGAASL